MENNLSVKQKWTLQENGWTWNYSIGQLEKEKPSIFFFICDPGYNVYMFLCKELCGYSRKFRKETKQRAMLGDKEGWNAGNRTHELWKQV